MTKQTSYKCFLTLATCVLLSHQALARSQFLPEAVDNFGNFSRLPNGVVSDYQHCLKLGYTIKSCPEGYALDIKERCPFGLNSPLYKKCYSLSNLCQEKGYKLSCPEGSEPNLNKYCPYDSLYVQCQCAGCPGYDYTEAEANAEGYIADGDPCMSCDTPMYKRKPADCKGFDWTTETCGATSCGNVDGEYCVSGTTVKYKDCSNCTVPPAPACPDGKVNIDTYWCNGALRCWWPENGISNSGSTQCTQTACFDYPYTAGITCEPGLQAKSCQDSCVGMRYKCEKPTCIPNYACNDYPLSEQSGCDHGYLSCNTGCETKYKCKDCVPNNTCSDYTLSSQNGCSDGYLSCDTGCGIQYKCKASCSGYTLSSQTGCPNGYLSCETGAETKYKCKPYAVGDSYYSNGILLGIVIEVKGNNLILASPPKASSAEIADFCDNMSPGSWYVPDHKYGPKILTYYQKSLTDPYWSYMRIKIGSDYSWDYCCDQSSTWSESHCKSSLYTLYNSCLMAAQQIQ